MISKSTLEDPVLPLSEEVVELASPMSEDRRYVRNSLLPSLLSSVAYNQARNQKDIALFEIANVYGKEQYAEHLVIAASGALTRNRWKKFSVDVDFYTIKGLILTVLEALGFSGNRVMIKENTMDTKNFHPYRSAVIYLGKTVLGIFGEIHPSIAKKYGIEPTIAAELDLEVLLSNKASKVKFEEVSKYPAVSRDLAMVVAENVKVEKIIAGIRKNGKLGKENIIKSVEVFDVYTGEHVEKGFKSIALSMVFQSFEKTLKDQEINTIFNQIIETLEKEVNAQLRK